MHRIQYPAQSSIQLKRMRKLLSDSMNELEKPVAKIVGKGDKQSVIYVKDYDALCLVIRTMSMVIEQQRVVLRIPSPGRDANVALGQLIEMLPADIVQAGEAMPSEPPPSNAPPEPTS